MIQTAAAVRSPVAGREYGLDWLRVFAFAILILYHSGMGYVSWEWHVKNPEKSQALEYVMLAANRWRLPLLFFISGAGVYFSLRRRNFGEFTRERLRRLLIPLAVGMFIVVPPQIYFERLFQGAQFTYAEFYPSVFEFVAYPQGSFSWHHLWFVAYILVFSLIGIPVFAGLRSERGQRAVKAMVRFFTRVPAAIYLITVPNILVGVLLGPHWPTRQNLVADWANFTATFLTFLWGFTIASSREFLDLITRRRREFAVVGLLIAVVFFTARISQFPARWPAEGRLWFGNVVNGYYGLTWILALVGYARSWFTRPSSGLSYATEVVYPFYIFHQTITVAAVYFLIPVEAAVWTKISLVALITVAGSWMLVEVVRRVRVLRPLFGLKPAQTIR